MKILFINDSTSNPNWGDRAATIALMKMITESGGEIIDKVTELELITSTYQRGFSEVSYGTERRSIKEIVKTCIPPVAFTIKEKIFSLINRSDDGTHIPRRWDEYDSCLKFTTENPDILSGLYDTIQQADLVVIHGGGSMTGNGMLPRAILFLTYVVKKHFNKPVIITNHTVDFEQQEMLDIARNIYPLFDDVVFRDVVSVEKCKSICDGRYAPDSAFLFEPYPLETWLPVAQRSTYFDVWPDIAHFDPGKPYICLGGSSLYPYLNDPSSPVEGYIKLVDHLSTIYPDQIVLTVSDGRDQGIFQPIAKRFNLPLVGLSTPVQQAVDIIGNSAAYIGGRWHPSIFALRGGVPIIPISSKTFKMQALATMSGLASTAFDATKLDTEKERIGQELLNHLNKGNEMRRNLHKWAEHQSERCWGNVSYLQNKQ